MVQYKAYRSPSLFEMHFITIGFRFFSLSQVHKKNNLQNSKSRIFKIIIIDYNLEYYKI